MNETLREMFRYHTWATLTLLDFCASQPEHLDDTLPGTMGSIREIFAHLIASDAGYQARLRADPSLRIPDKESLSLDDLRAIFVERSKGWGEVLDRIDDFDPQLEADPDEDYPEIPHARDLLLLQAIHHGNDHRTHVCSILGSKGIEPPWMDVWAYWVSAER
jgi:uncharacterized damage-inducible protein DinB